jgi:hypothetical protein
MCTQHRLPQSWGPALSTLINLSPCCNIAALSQSEKQTSPTTTTATTSTPTRHEPLLLLPQLPLLSHLLLQLHTRRHSLKLRLRRTSLQGYNSSRARGSAAAGQSASSSRCSLRPAVRRLLARESRHLWICSPPHMCLSSQAASRANEMHTATTHHTPHTTHHTPQHHTPATNPAHLPGSKHLLPRAQQRVLQRRQLVGVQVSQARGLAGLVLPEGVHQLGGLQSIGRPG